MLDIDLVIDVASCEFQGAETGAAISEGGPSDGDAPLPIVIEEGALILLDAAADPVRDRAEAGP